MMGAFGQWFHEIWLGLNTTRKGMWITLTHLFKEPYTIEYPDVNVEATLPERYRGILQVDMDICISCHNCENACPIGCIVIEDVKGEKSSVHSKITGKPTPKVRYPLRFDIDIAKCMYCGLCVEPCPTGSIRHTRRFEGSVLNVSSLTYSYVRPEDQELADAQVAKAAQKAAAGAATTTEEIPPAEAT